MPAGGRRKKLTSHLWWRREGQIVCGSYTPAHSFSTGGLLIFGVECCLLQGLLLGIIGCSAVPLASTHWIPSHRLLVGTFVSLLLFSHSVVSDSLWPHGLRQARLICPLLSPGICSTSCPLSCCYHPTISSSVTLFSSCLQSFPAPGSFLVNQLFATGGQSIGASASASVLPKNIQGWFLLGLTGLISLLSKGISRVFSSTTIRNQQFFSSQSSLWSSSHVQTWLLEKP